MIYLTVDRLADILLNIKYPLYWNTRRTKVLMCGTWMFGFLLSVTVSLLYRFEDFNWEEVFFTYVCPSLDFAFILIALVTYACIFRIYKRTHDTVASCYGQQRRTTARRASSLQVFRKSRFYVSVLMILTFFVFMVIPDLVYLFVAIVEGYKTTVLVLSCYISYGVSNVLDAWIYIYLQAPVRRLLMKKLGMLGVGGNSYSMDVERSSSNVAVVTKDL